MNTEAVKHFHPTALSPLVKAYHVACAVETKSGEVFSGFCIESSCGIVALCAERVAAINMLVNSGEIVVKRLLVRREFPPGKDGGGGMPCGACREFFMQLSSENKDMEIIVDFDNRKTVTLEEMLPRWWGWKRYNT